MYDDEYPLDYSKYSADNPWDDTPPPPVEVSNIVQLSLNEGSTVGDLRRFLQKIRDLELDDKTPLLGDISIVHVLNDCTIERIHCGECNYQDFLVSPSDHPVNNCTK